VFASLSSSYRCHVRRRLPDVIYRVSLSVTLPGPRGLQSATLEEQLLATSTDQLSVHRQRRTLFDVLTVQHDVGGPPLDTELLLTATQTTHDDDDDDVTTNYTAQAATVKRNSDSKDTEWITRYSPGVLQL